jgi:hypothetical protein
MTIQGKLKKLLNLLIDKYIGELKASSRRSSFMYKYRYWLLLALVCLPYSSTGLLAGEEEHHHHYSSIHTRHEVTPHLHKACHIFLTSELLYWTTKEEGLDYGMSYYPPVTGLINIYGKIHSNNPHFRLGYRNAIKHEIGNSRWDLNLVWTSYSNDSDDRARLKPGQTFAVYNINHNDGPFGFGGANAHWGIDFNAIDFEVGYNLGWKSRFGVRPFAGLKYAKIEQRVRIDYLEVGALAPARIPHFFTRDHYTSQNYGLRFGANSQFNAGGGFKIFFNAAVAALWGNFDLMHNEKPAGGFVRTVYHNHVESINPEIELAAGIGWQTFFDDKQYYLDLRLGWEQQIWLSQNQTFKQVSPNAYDQIVTEEHDLSFAGPTFSLTFGF